MRSQKSISNSIPQWRLIRFQRFDAVRNMAADDALAESVLAGLAPPTLRFYGWSAPAVTIGAFQKIEEVDLDECKRLGVSVVRRPTGGRAILHHPDELTYSFSSRFSYSGFPTGSASNESGVFSESVLDNYKAINTAFYIAFKNLGIDVTISERRLKRPEIPAGNPLCFASTSYSELSVGGRKLAGSAQKKYKDGFLQQGSIPFIASDDLSKIIFKGIGDGHDTCTVHQAAPNVGIEDLTKAITAAFEERFGVTMTEGGFTVSEVLKTNERLEKYSSDGWNLRK
jgi:lipoate-protein ligase A